MIDIVSRHRTSRPQYWPGPASSIETACTIGCEQRSPPCWRPFSRQRSRRSEPARDQPDRLARYARRHRPRLRLLRHHARPADAGLHRTGVLHRRHGQPVHHARRGDQARSSTATTLTAPASSCAGHAMTRTSTTVLVEWTNVTNGFDAENVWFFGWEHMLRAGYAWVGVSAQQVGVNRLKSWSPRYGALDVTQGGTIPTTRFPTTSCPRPDRRCATRAASTCSAT